MLRPCHRATPRCLLLLAGVLVLAEAPSPCRAQSTSPNSPASPNSSASLEEAAKAEGAATTLVLPLRMIGVSDTTATVTRDLLADELASRGWRVIARDAMAGELLPSADACDEPECAARRASEHSAARAVYGSLSRLGDKVIFRLGAIRAGETVPFYREQFSAISEEELDTVVRRLAEGLVAGRPNSDQPTVESVIREEARKPLRRSSRSGLGFRAGFLFPTGDSYAGEDRLTSLRASYKYEQPTFFVETTSLLGFTFGGGNVDWTILDIVVSKILGKGDVCPYIGGGLGVHSVRIERTTELRHTYNGSAYTYTETEEQSSTAPSLELVLGLLSMRTFDFEIMLEARYHHVFESFDKVGGDGAQGVCFTIGTHR